jgi:hypothetical protein
MPGKVEGNAFGIPRRSIMENRPAGNRGTRKKRCVKTGRLSGLRIEPQMGYYFFHTPTIVSLIEKPVRITWRVSEERFLIGVRIEFVQGYFFDLPDPLVGKAVFAPDRFELLAFEPEYEDVGLLGLEPVGRPYEIDEIRKRPVGHF